MTVVSWIFVALYSFVALLVFFGIRRLERSIRQSRHGRRHPEMFRYSLISDIFASILWPLDIFGVLMLLFGRR